MCSLHVSTRGNDDSDEDSYTCRSCQEQFFASDFDSVDDELNANRPMCPPCQEAARLEYAECEQCGEPATHEVELGPLCDNCFEHYTDGYRDRD